MSQQYFCIKWCSNCQYCFRDRDFVIVCQKSSLNSGWMSFYVIFWKFFDLCFTVRLMIPFELIFVKDVKAVSRFLYFFCMWASSCSMAICWKDYSSSNCLFSFLKDQLTIFWGSIAGLSIVLHRSLSVLSPMPFWLEHHSSTGSLQVG